MMGQPIALSKRRVCGILPVCAFQVAAILPGGDQGAKVIIRSATQGDRAAFGGAACANQGLRSGGPSHSASKSRQAVRTP